MHTRITRICITDTIIRIILINEVNCLLCIDKNYQDSL